MEQTLFQVKCEIMSQMYELYSKDTKFTQLFYINDVGFVLAWAYANSLVSLEGYGVDMIDQTWDSFLEWFGLTDTGFTELSDIYSE